MDACVNLPQHDVIELLQTNTSRKSLCRLLRIETRKFDAAQGFLEERHVTLTLSRRCGQCEHPVTSVRYHDDVSLIDRLRLAWLCPVQKRLRVIEGVRLPSSNSQRIWCRAGVCRKPNEFLPSIPKGDEILELTSGLLAGGANTRLNVRELFVGEECVSGEDVVYLVERIIRLDVPSFRGDDGVALFIEVIPISFYDWRWIV